MAFITQNMIDAAAERIVNTRDFCGNELEAVRDFWADNGIAKADGLRVEGLVFVRANELWAESQKAAGVAHKFWKVGA